jgi:lipoyl(octanoyl) transferase
MALDERLLEWTLSSGVAVIRFYAWDHPARTVGYFTRHPVGIGDGEMNLVRRFTGGGLVEHGSDLTFALAVPAGTALGLASAAERYRSIHEALAAALLGAGIEVIPVAPDRETSPGPCFAHPVPWDLIHPISGLKIAGGAQRRSRGAFLHQGSIRLAEPLRSTSAPWVDTFVSGLAGSVASIEPGDQARLVSGVASLVATRYGDPVWNAGKRPPE